MLTVSGKQKTQYVQLIGLGSGVSRILTFPSLQCLFSLVVGCGRCWALQRVQVEKGHGSVQLMLVQ
jgi:hypothetical protein